MTDSVILRQPWPTEAALLSDIAMESKAHWGYSEEFMLACCDELVVLESDISKRAHDFCVAVSGDVVQGFYSLAPKDAFIVEMEALFVLPRYIGSGLGRKLFKHARDNATQREFETLTIQSDPFAVDFYGAMGAIQTGQKESGSIPGRYLPLLEYSLS